jgi:hypothetical protein
MMSDSADDGVIRERLPDETLLVFLSDTHIGGTAGSDIFESAAVNAEVECVTSLNQRGRRGDRRAPAPPRP